MDRSIDRSRTPVEKITLIDPSTGVLKSPPNKAALAALAFATPGDPAFTPPPPPSSLTASLSSSLSTTTSSSSSSSNGGGNGGNGGDVAMRRAVGFPALSSIFLNEVGVAFTRLLLLDVDSMLQLRSALDRKHFFALKPVNLLTWPDVS